MRDGEIVRIRDVFTRIESAVHDYGYCNDQIEVATVAELFEAAGCPVPRDGYLCQLFGELCVFRDCEPLRDQPCRKRFRLKLFDRLEGEKWEWAADGVFDSTNMIDLSRLPALDAWNALPEVIKAVVK
jgi:hypothetical protein